MNVRVVIPGAITIAMGVDGERKILLHDLWLIPTEDFTLLPFHLVIFFDMLIAS